MGGATDAFNALWQSLVTQLFGLWWSVQFALTDLMVEFVATVMLESGDTLSSCSAAGFSSRCLGSDWFPHAYEGSIRVGAVLAFFALFMIGVILVVRSVMIQIVLILAPLVSVTLLTKWAGTAKMLMTKLFGLIPIKPVIVIILGLGAAILSGSGTGRGASLF